MHENKKASFPPESQQKNNFQKQIPGVDEDKHLIHKTWSLFDSHIK